MKREILEKLAKLANMLDAKGLVEEADEIDNMFKSIASEADMFGEMSQMEKNPPKNTAPQNRFEQLWQAQQQAQPSQLPQPQLAPPAAPTGAVMSGPSAARPQPAQTAQRPAQPATTAPAAPSRMKPNPELQKAWLTLNPQQQVKFKELRRKNPLIPIQQALDLAKR